MRLLDLFCGGGGCSVGYHRAGFEVVGVDLHPQPNYPYEFKQDDALDVLRWFLNGDGWGIGPYALRDFDAIHASPPCQHYIRGGLSSKDGRHSDLLGPTRDLLEATGLPYVIENVPGAPMRPDIVLCGSQFGLNVRRHRWFETNWSGPLMTLACDHSRPITGVYGNPAGKRGKWPGMLPADHETWAREMGIDWMTSAELALAIPPAYTELIGHQLATYLTQVPVNPQPS